MRLKALSLFAVTSLVLAGCSAPAPEAAEPEPMKIIEPSIRIVASTNVWGDIAKSIGGESVEVVSIIDSFGQDPHSYEASARDQLAVNDADLVIANGGGYDSFIEVLASASGDKQIIFAYEPELLVIDETTQKPDAVDDDHGHDHDHDHGNEHIWYDFHVVEDFANRIALKLRELDSENSATYDRNLILFLDQLITLEDRADELSLKLEGKRYISAETVADYLLDSLSLKNLTPKDFSSAIEEERELSPRILLEVQNLLKNKRVELFVVNIQTGSPQITALVELAKENQIPVVELSELLPEGLSYLGWMDQNISLIESGLS
jgi:zinc/manganese transport system substrate-binding protein